MARKLNPDIFLFNNDVPSHIAGILAATAMRKPCVVRKSGLGNSNDSNKLLRRFLSRFVDLYVCSSRAEYEAHVACALPYKKMVIIYEGVDIDQFEGAALPSAQNIRLEFGLAPDQPLVGNISRFEAGKGQDIFIKAAHKVVKKFPNAVFLIVGSDVDEGTGTIRRELEHLVKLLGIGRSVIFTGWRDDVRSILASIDVFVHCPDTWKEGMGIATLEAIASGKPVIVSDNWGLAETTVNEYNGFVVPVGDETPVADCLALLLGDAELRGKMGENGRRRAEQEFDMSRNIVKFELLLENL